MEHGENGLDIAYTQTHSLAQRHEFSFFSFFLLVEFSEDVDDDDPAYEMRR